MISSKRWQKVVAAVSAQLPSGYKFSMMDDLARRTVTFRLQSDALDSVTAQEFSEQELANRSGATWPQVAWDWVVEQMAMHSKTLKDAEKRKVRDKLKKLLTALGKDAPDLNVDLSKPAPADYDKMAEALSKVVDADAEELWQKLTSHSPPVDVMKYYKPMPIFPNAQEFQQTYMPSTGSVMSGQMWTATSIPFGPPVTTSIGTGEVTAMCAGCGRAMSLHRDANGVWSGCPTLRTPEPLTNPAWRRAQADPLTQPGKPGERRIVLDDDE
jgi:hypothetical protein